MVFLLGGRITPFLCAYIHVLEYFSRDQLVYMLPQTVGKVYKRVLIDAVGKNIR